jgi:hypothetical protein
VKKQTYTSSNTYSIICPCCGINELERSAAGVVGCSRCDRPISIQVLKTLEQIVSLPDAIGSHACECSHPEMRASGRRCSVVSWLWIGGSSLFGF